MVKWYRTKNKSWTKKDWRKVAKDIYFAKGGKDKGKPTGAFKLFNGKYYSRNPTMPRNDKVASIKKYWKDRDYSVRTKKEGKFTKIWIRPNFENPKK